MKLFLMLVFCLFLHCPAQEGRVIHCKDGDTLIFLQNDGHWLNVQLYGIDTPEMDQPYGLEAKQALEKWVLLKFVYLSVKGRDCYGRTVAQVFLPFGEGQGLDVGLCLIRQGFAWYYTDYAKDETLYLATESAARKMREGLWKQKNPTPPWRWRRLKREKKTQEEDQ